MKPSPAHTSMLEDYHTLPHISSWLKRQTNHHDTPFDGPANRLNCDDCPAIYNHHSSESQSANSAQ